MKNLTIKQRKQIEKAYIKVWDNIYENILTKENKGKKGIVNKNVLFEMEDIVKSHASEFGLAALGEG